MANFIQEFVEHNRKVLKFREQIIYDSANADNDLKQVQDFLIESQYNSAVGVGLARLLQLLNKTDNFSDFELADVSSLYKSLIELERDNIDAYVEAGHFEWAVMDNNEVAIEIAKEGIERAKQKIAELESLLLAIKQE